MIMEQLLTIMDATVWIKNGNPMFDMMLEPNKKIAEFMKKDPVFGKNDSFWWLSICLEIKGSIREKRILSEKTWNWR